MKKRKRSSTSPAATASASITAPLADSILQLPVSPPAPCGDEVIAEHQLLTRLPVSRRTLFDWRKRRIIPAIQIGARVLYHWPSVRDALLRHQRGSLL